MIKEIKITELPDSLKKVAMVFKEEVRIFECDTTKALIGHTVKLPLDISIIAQTKNKVIERYFMVGLMMPSIVDKIACPVLYFTSISNNEYERINNLVTKHKTDKQALLGEL